MKQYNVINAIKVLRRLNDEHDLPLTISYSLYKLTLSLQPHWDWQVGEEQKLIEQYGTNDGNGVSFSEEGRASYNDALSAICNTEVEVDWDVVIIPLDDRIHISGNEIKTLEGFIEFVERG